MSLFELSAEDQGWLLRRARAALEAEVTGGNEPAASDAPSDALRLPGGAFVSVHSGGELRGCVGYADARWPLVETVARAARAVTHDRRFPPLRGDELPHVDLEISVLTVLAPIRADEVEIGRHGLVVECAGRSGLLLPQVPIQYGWDRETYLDQLCRKAGLPVGAWRRTDAVLLAFAAQVFGEAS